MTKVLLYPNGGGYSATILTDEEAMSFENDGCCVVTIPKQKALEWQEICDKMEDFQKLWKSLSNEWYDSLGFNPTKE